MTFHVMMAFLVLFVLCPLFGTLCCCFAPNILRLKSAIFIKPSVSVTSLSSYSEEGGEPDCNSHDSASIKTMVKGHPTTQSEFHRTLEEAARSFVGNIHPQQLGGWGSAYGSRKLG